MNSSGAMTICVVPSLYELFSSTSEECVGADDVEHAVHCTLGPDYRNFVSAKTSIMRNQRELADVSLGD